MKNLKEELLTLDWRDPGRWSLPVRILAVAVFFVVCLVLIGYLWVYNSRAPELKAKEDEEAALRADFKTKHSKAINLETYERQLQDIQKSFGAMLRQLPSKTEVPNLLVDISQTGLSAALQQKLFQPGEEIKRDFYAELPITIKLTGSYHEFGEFVSGIAALPRIVTLSDIQIIPADKSTGYDQLELDLTAKTYRYLDDDEVARAEAEKHKSDKDAKHGAAGGA